MIQFAQPWFLMLFLPIPFLIFRRNKGGALKFSSIALMKKQSSRVRFKRFVGRTLITLALGLFVVALARPRIQLALQPNPEEALDIAMVLDVSGSMASVDFEPTRLEVAKKTMIDFANRRLKDRLAFIIFGGSAYTKIPLTFDHDMVVASLKDVTLDSVKEEGTAIGMALSVGVNRLKKSEAKSKVIILVTDGDNNAGAINPETASALAKDLGIKVYSIGVGSGKTILPVNFFGQTKYQTYEGGLNEPLLKDIAARTGGSYYRAKDSTALTTIFDEINRLETTEFQRENRNSYKELAFDFMKVGLIILLVGLYFETYKYLRIP